MNPKSGSWLTSALLCRAIFPAVVNCSASGTETSSNESNATEGQASRPQLPQTAAQVTAFAHDLFIGDVVTGPEYVVNDAGLPYSVYDVAVIDTLQGSMEGTVRVGHLGGPDREGSFASFEGEIGLETDETYLLATALSDDGYHLLIQTADHIVPKKVGDSDLESLTRQWTTAVDQPDQTWLDRYPREEDLNGEAWVERTYAESQID